MARAKSTIKKQIIKEMKGLNIYKPEYRTTIDIYADMIQQYEIFQELFEQSGYQVEEEYTNKAGATNMRKTPLLTTIEKLRVDIAKYSDMLCLNPKALEKVTAESNSKSTLADILKGFD